MDGGRCTSFGFRAMAKKWVVAGILMGRTLSVGNDLDSIGGLLMST